MNCYIWFEGIQKLIFVYLGFAGLGKIGIYCGMAVAGRFICEVAGIDYTGGFNASFDTIIAGLGYASPPIMALLFILDDEVVKFSPHARAIRDVEDEELRGFFHGMSAWQFILVVAASSVGEFEIKPDGEQRDSSEL